VSLSVRGRVSGNTLLTGEGGAYRKGGLLILFTKKGSAPSRGRRAKMYGKGREDLKEGRGELER